MSQENMIPGIIRLERLINRPISQLRPSKRLKPEDFHEGGENKELRVGFGRDNGLFDVVLQLLRCSLLDVTLIFLETLFSEFVDVSDIENSGWYDLFCSLSPFSKSPLELELELRWSKYRTISRRQFNGIEPKSWKRNTV
ncbi:11903_t:CDS:2 [Racocetra fulgida]|uniref:11903_t:CDS:1 n=1 Tax=Racocetra fulgida TaxID=60492 RepID=A0A9N8YXX6_9GLOM|nr:11903_t:CDS:2 [Racocetra fulgida]